LLRYRVSFGCWLPLATAVMGDHRYGSTFVRNGCWLLLVVAIVMVGFSIVTTACCCWQSPL